MDDKELEKTKPIEIISDVSESRFSKYNDEKQEEVSRVEKHKEVLEEEQNRIDEEAAEEALAEKNIALAESYLAEEKQEVLEEPEPQKKMKLIDKIKAKWDDMDKKQRIMLIVVLALVLILIVIFTIFIVIKLNKKDTLDKPEKKVEEKAKAKLKKALKIKLIPVVAGILALVIIAMSFYAIMMTVEGKLIELRSNLTTAVTSFWKWMADDYWIKLDKEIEFSYLDEETRRRN